MWLWRVKWRWVRLVWGVLVRTCHPGQTHQVSWLDPSKNTFWNRSTSSSILSKVLVQPWSLLLTKIKVYFYSRGSQIQCASTEHPSTLGSLLYFYLFWPLFYSIFSHFSHILFLQFCHLEFTVDSKVGISSRGNAFLMWLRKNLTGSAVIDRNNHGSIVHTRCIPISCRHCHKDGRVVAFLRNVAVEPSSRDILRLLETTTRGLSKAFAPGPDGAIFYRHYIMEATFTT